ncbi:MAG: hypothetical protein A2Y07_10990 [Planctomycetes bacterium GWF2_50_10]|nr:MAG: hypothetical protein A2Y07_10990 [Planctomycetes bacterium GWF2_50_10]
MWTTINMKIVAAIGILLLIPSLPAIYWCGQQESKLLRQSELYKAQYKAEADEFAASIVKMRDPAQFEKLRRDNPDALERMKTQQAHRLLADIDDLASGAMNAPANASFLYGSNWIEAVAKYKSQQQYNDLISLLAYVAAGMGAALTAAGLFVLLVKLIVKLLSLPAMIIKKLRSAKPAAVAPSLPGQEKFTYVRGEVDPKQQTIAVASILQEINTAISAQRAFVENTLRQFTEEFKAAPAAASSKDQDEKIKAIGAQLDEIVQIIKEASEPFDIEGFSSRVASAVLPDITKINASLERLPQSLEKIAVANQDAVKEQCAQLSQAAGANFQQTEALSKTVDDFAAQFNAIRDYAAYQQQRLARLEDGYDWNIIKHFCMRVVRCIDNLDARIAELDHVGVNTEHLRHIREELTFVLESSGVEPFGARVGSEYRGQETRLQVLDEKEPTDDPSLIGKIAQVLEPGYQCVLSTDKVKIVRPAQVRIYALASKQADQPQQLTEMAGSVS